MNFVSILRSIYLNIICYRLYIVVFLCEIKVKLHAFAMMDGVARNVISSDDAYLLNYDYSQLGLPVEVNGTGIVCASQANDFSQVVWYID